MQSCSRLTLILVSSVLGGSAFAGPLDPYFSPLGDLPGGAFTSYAYGLSDNGLVVVGASAETNGALGILGRLASFRGGPSGNIAGIEIPPISLLDSSANGVSGDGLVTVGSDSFGLPYRWTSTGGLQNLPLPATAASGEGLATSRDGSVVVGGYRLLSGLTLLSRAFRWTSGGGTVPITDGNADSIANGVSANGNTIVGRYGTEAFRWTLAGGYANLGDLPGGAVDSEALDVSANGTVIVGRATSASGTEAFRQASGVMVGLGDLPGGAFVSIAHGVSPDGRIIVGSGTTASGERAMIWDAVHGMRSLQTLLVDQGLAPDLAGWTLLSARDVTVAASGLTVVAGYGIDPSGNTQAFLTAAPLVANFTSLGALPGGNFVSSSRALSADGSTVVGVSGSVTGDRAFVWRSDTGMFDIGTGAAGATGVSSDGSTVVGVALNGEGFRWRLTGANLLGPSTRASAVSADGEAIAGSYIIAAPNPASLRSTTYRWTTNSTESYPSYIGVNRLPAAAAAISANGSVLVGTSEAFSGVSAVSRAFLWRTDGSQLTIPAISGGNGESEATGVSGDGTVVVGWSRGPDGPEAFRWTNAGGIVGLGDLPGGGFASRALAVSPDGNVIVGMSSVAGQNAAFIWDSAHGMRDLLAVLSARGLSNELDGWSLFSASGVSVTPNGVIVVTGTGTDPDGRTQSFLATLPPSTLQP